MMTQNTFPLLIICSNELEIFVHRKNLADDDEFDYHFLVALMNGAIFSGVVYKKKTMLGLYSYTHRQQTISDKYT